MITALLWALGCTGWAMIYVPAWLSDSEEDRPPLGWLVAGLIAWPILIFVILMVVASRPTTRGRR